MKKQDQLEELMQEKKWKLALKTIETRQKKGDKSDGLLVKKMIVWANTLQKQHVLLVRSEINKLLARKPPLSDLNLLCELDDRFAAAAYLYNDMADLWGRAADARAQDVEFQQVLFARSIENDRIALAQKAAMQWQKAVPNQNTPFFLYIMSCHLLSSTSHAGEKEKKFASMLSHRWLSKAVEEAPSAELRKGVTSSSRAVETLEDLLLVVRVYRSQDKFQEALKVLHDPKIGFLSGVARRNWEVIRQMIELYPLCRKWDELLSLCQGILSHVYPTAFDIEDDPDLDFGQLGDDWVVWDGLVVAAIELARPFDDRYESRHFSSVTGFFTRGDSLGPSRNFKLANIKLHALRCEDDDQSNDECFSLMCAYFNIYSSKVSCFDDLSPYLRYLNKSAQEEFLLFAMDSAQKLRPSMESREVERLAWFTAETNALKLEYYLVVSRNDNLRIDELLPSFVANCLRLYSLSLQFQFNLPPSDRLPGDDAAILAAMGLIRMNAQKGRSPAYCNSLYKCIMVLESALSKSKHNYDILLLLVRLHTHVGTGSLAIERYAQMSVKNLQHITLPWVLFTRLSTVHPYPANISQDGGKTKVTVDPLKEMISILDWHDSASALNLQSIQRLQENKAWTMQLDAIGTQRVLQYGFNRALILSESCRIRRLRSHEGSHVDDEPILDFPQRILETRDRLAFPDYEAAGQAVFEELLPSPIFPSLPVDDRWLAVGFLQARLWSMCNTAHKNAYESGAIVTLWNNSKELDPGVERDEEELRRFTDMLMQVIDSVGSLGKGRDPRQESQTVSMLRFVTHLMGVHPTSDMADRVLGRSGQGKHAPNATLFSQFYLKLEMCVFARKFISSIPTFANLQDGVQSEFAREAIADLEIQTRIIAANVWSDAMACRDMVAQDGFVENMIRGLMSEDAVGGELQQLASQTIPPRDFCKMLQESWMDGFDGILRTKIF